MPKIKALKRREDFLFLPSTHFKACIDIAVFSFGNDQAAFNELLAMFRDAFHNNLEEIEDTSLLTLLDALGARMAAFDERWFRNQKGVNEFLSKVLAMVDEHKVPRKFDDKLCKALLKGDVTPDYYLA